MDGAEDQTVPGGSGREAWGEEEAGGGLSAKAPVGHTGKREGGGKEAW